MDGFQRHFDSQVVIYGKQSILNLVRNHVVTAPFSTSCRFTDYFSDNVAMCVLQVNQKGSEKPLEQAFARMVSNMSNDVIK